jgi:hypothetical protein
VGLALGRYGPPAIWAVELAPFHRAGVASFVAA